MKEFDELVEIFKKLRSENGCPWDRKQTIESLKKFLLEETYETLEAMGSDGDNVPDPYELEGELGDLMLQIVFQSQIMAEKGVFTISDVIKHLNKKMIRRHPHIFGDVNVKNSAEVTSNWNEIKKKEKGHENRTSLIDGVPKALPSIARCQKLLSKARKLDVGFTSDKYPKDMDRLENVSAEIVKTANSDEEKSKDLLRKLLVDNLFLISEISREFDIDLETSFSSRISNFEKDFKTHEKKYSK